VLPVRSLPPASHPPAFSPGDDLDDDRGGPTGGTSRRRAVGLVALAVVIVAAVGALAAITFSSGDNDAATSSPAPPVSTGPTAGPTGTPEEILRGLINPATMKACQSKEPVDSRWADAQLSCTGVDGVPVSAFHFASQSALDRQIGTLATYFSDEGECDSGQASFEEWNTPQEPTGGTRLCYFYAKKFVIYWFYTEDRIAFAAEDPSPTKLADWWRTFDPVNH
jgi:hypothetical protein